MIKTIKFTNRERIMIGSDHIKYMDALKQKLPDANYSDDDELANTFEKQIDSILFTTGINANPSIPQSYQGAKNKGRLIKEYGSGSNVATQPSIP